MPFTVASHPTSIVVATLTTTTITTRVPPFRMVYSKNLISKILFWKSLFWDSLSGSHFYKNKIVILKIDGVQEIIDGCRKQLPKFN